MYIETYNCEVCNEEWQIEVDELGAGHKTCPLCDMSITRYANLANAKRHYERGGSNTSN